MDEPTYRRQVHKTRACRSICFAGTVQKDTDGQQPVGTDQGQYLVDGNPEGDRIDQPQQTQDHEARKPVTWGDMAGFIFHVILKISFSTRPAALYPHIPWTPPPGGVEA